MFRPHYKLIKLQCELLGSSEHITSCDELQLRAVFEAHDGSRIETNHRTLAYHELNADPEQFPWLVASTLRSIMIEVAR